MEARFMPKCGFAAGDEGEDDRGAAVTGAPPDDGAREHAGIEKTRNTMAMRRGAMAIIVRQRST
jgi:hypothetical protein